MTQVLSDLKLETGKSIQTANVTTPAAIKAKGHADSERIRVLFVGWTLAGLTAIYAAALVFCEKAPNEVLVLVGTLAGNLLANQSKIEQPKK